MSTSNGMGSLHTVSSSIHQTSDLTHPSTTSTSTKRDFLKTQFRVGSAMGDKVNYSLSQKVFHSGDVPREVLEAKKLVQKKKQRNILGTERAEWNQSTIADARHKDVSKDLKRQLLKVRAGLMDEYVQKPSKFHAEDAIRDRQKFVVSITGKGPVGKLSGKWFNSVDERGLPKHCDEALPDWNASSSTYTKDDRKEVEESFCAFEERRIRSNTSKVTGRYVHPMQSTQYIGDQQRERKLEFHELKQQFKRDLKAEFPIASEERLQAMAQRLLDDKLLQDEKLARFPVEEGHFRPNLTLTSQDRRYKVHEHTGTWAWSEAERCHCWTCCMNFSEDSRGCEHRVVNPDAWSLAGFERYHAGKGL